MEFIGVKKGRLVNMLSYEHIDQTLTSVQMETTADV